MESKDLVQIEVTAKRLISIWMPQSKRGDTHWVPFKAAQKLIETGMCRLAPAPKKEAVTVAAPVVADRRPMRASNDAPVDRFAVIDRAWEGKTVVCIASGPSVTKDQLEQVRAARERDAIRVAVVNDMYLVCPWADLLYFADAVWWKWHTDGIAKSWPWAKFTVEEVRKAFAEFSGQKVTVFNTGMNVKDGAVFMLHHESTAGLSEKPNTLHTGSNSGYQVLNLVYLTGAKRIALVGYDMRYSGGKSHSHNGHPHKMPESSYRGFAKSFATTLPQFAKRGMEVVNCTPGSEIKCFPAKTLGECLGPSS